MPETASNRFDEHHNKQIKKNSDMLEYLKQLEESMTRE